MRRILATLTVAFTLLFGADRRGLLAWRRGNEAITPPPYKSGDRLPSRVIQRPRTASASCTPKAGRNVKAAMWCSLAKAQGDKEAGANLGIVKK